MSAQHTHTHKRPNACTHAQYKSGCCTRAVFVTGMYQQRQLVLVALVWLSRISYLRAAAGKPTITSSFGMRILIWFWR